MNNNVDEIINLINSVIINSYAISISVPSAPTLNIQFKPLTIVQQKDLISTTASNNLYNTEFIKIFYKILKDNYLSESILPFNNLNILDKTLISLALKCNINNIYLNLKLDELISNIQLSDLSVFAPKKFNINNIELFCQLPSIDIDFQCENERNTPLLEDINEQIQHIISETVINELAKFSVKAIIDNNLIDLYQYSFNDRKQIISQIPAFILDQALDYIINCKQQIEKLLTFTDTENKESLIQINGAFFATS